jgi:GH24 family phage-related lysozyme (muramidase)
MSTPTIAIARPLIAEFEGCRLRAYPDPGTGGDPITIGYGSTRDRNGQPFRLGDTITETEADALLDGELERMAAHLQRSIPSWDWMGPGQQAALLSFAYNVGEHFYGSSGFNTITRALASPAGWPDVPAALALYCNPGTAVEAGLRRRRQAEADLWARGGDAPAPPPPRKPLRLVATAIAATFLKKSTDPAASLPSDQVVQVAVGKQYPLTAWAIAERGHHRIRLDYAGGDWYVWPNDWRFSWED